MNAYITTAEQLNLSRAFARYSLARPEVQRDAALVKLIRHKVAKLEQLNTNLRLANDSQR